MFESMAKDEERGIGHGGGRCGRIIAEDEPRGGTRAGFGQYKVGGVSIGLEDHVACSVAEDGVRVIMEVIHQHLCLGVGVGGGRGLDGAELIERRLNARVYLGVKIERAGDGLDASCGGCIEGRGRGGRSWFLSTFAAIDGGLPGVRGMLGAVTGRYVVEAF